MAFKLAASALEEAIKHLCKYDYPNVFPHFPELALFRDERAAIVTELKGLTLISLTHLGRSRFLRQRALSASEYSSVEHCRHGLAPP
ncbi:hypothetical protein [Telmatospirillum sp. J64-1]|uniref:hypothetical protein n=1 Tax=Telmatospirillum sp. J64-1 TaxID=2502183 RepID=UPI00115CD246|nr:hypothetical protein [Telmatospirillum sp. J64-1]